MIYDMPLSNFHILRYTFAKAIQALFKPIALKANREPASMRDLEILWVKNNHLIVAHANNLQGFPSINSSRKLSFILRGNYLSTKIIQKLSKTSPINILKRSCDQKERLPFIIEPLSYMTLKAAESLRDRIFENDLKKIEKNLLLASLDPKRYKRIYEKNGVLGLSYWVARDKISKQVIGLTGIYTEEDGETCWLGWFCIDEAYRGKNFGKKLLEFSIQQARKMEKKYLHIHTYNASRFKKAITLYERMFFYRYAIEGKNLYYKLSLQGRNYHTKLLELFTKDELEKLVDESMLDGKNIDVIFISGDTIVAEIFVDYRENTAKIAVLEDSGLGYNKILPKDEFLKIYNESKENPPQILEVDRKQKIY
jgi:GNAT superfamily N-acetyltransferase